MYNQQYVWTSSKDVCERCMAGTKGENLQELIQKQSQILKVLHLLFKHLEKEKSCKSLM